MNIEEIKKHINYKLNMEASYNYLSCLEYFNAVKSNDESLSDDEINKFTNELNDFQARLKKCDFNNNNKVMKLWLYGMEIITKYNCDPEIATKFITKDSDL
jgi:hypothetical protein